MTTQPNRFTFPVRVYYEDTDAGQIVYHSNYLKYMERARTEWLLSKGVNLHHHAETNGELFVVHDLSIRYHRPAQLCDDLVVVSQIIKRTRTRAIFSQNIFRGEELLTEGEVVIVSLDAETRRPRPLPDFFN